MNVPILPTVVRWACSHCERRLIVKGASSRIPLHPCGGMRGLMTPFVREGTRAKVEVREREDYIGSELVTKDNDGRPAMSIVTTRDDGQDCMVFAPCATAQRDG